MKYVIALLLLLLVPYSPAFAGRNFVEASSTLGVCSIDPVSAPLTIACWAKTEQNTISRIAVSIGTTTNAVERVQLTFRNAAPDSPGFTSVSSAGSSGEAVGLATWSTGVWSHVAGVLVSSSLRRVYWNGVSNGTNTTVVVADGLNQVVIGAGKSTSYTSFWTGNIAEVAVWDVALTDSELLSLAIGASPLIISPKSLKFYSPLVGLNGAEEVNLIGNVISLTNSPTQGEHPPKVYRK